MNAHTRTHTHMHTHTNVKEKQKITKPLLPKLYKTEDEKELGKINHLAVPAVS